MMLRAYLWKEWREQRWTLLAVAGSMAVLSVTAWLLMPDYFRTSGNCLMLTFLVALLLGLVLVVGELMPGEARRGQADFLRRMPGGAAMPVVSKLLIAATALGLCTAGALLCGWCLQGGATFGFNLAALQAEVRALVLLALALGAWCLAVSSWLPRGTLSLPATILFWLVCGLPVVLLLSTSPGMAESLLCSTDRAVAQWLLLGAGLPLACHAMANAFRFRRDPWGRLRSVALAAAVFVPLWGWTAVRVRQWQVVDPAAKGFRITRGYLGVGGRFAFLGTQTSGLWDRPWDLHNTNVPWPGHTLVVDLTSGLWRQVRSTNLLLSPMALANQGHGLGEYLPQEWLLAGSGNGWPDSDQHVLDGRTGADLGPLTQHRLPLDAHRSGTPFRLPDNRRAWFEGNQLMVERVGGGFEALPWSRDDLPVSMAGFGVRIIRRNQDSRATWFYDLTRKRAFPVRVVSNVHPTVVVRPGLWAVRRPTSLTAPYRVGALFWLDPETGHETRSEELPKGALLGAIADGRVLLDSTRPEDPRLVLLDPETGFRTAVAFVDGPAGVPDQIQLLSASTPAGDPIFWCYGSREGDGWLAVLREGVMRSTVALAHRPRLIAAPDEDSVIAIVAERTIERLWWDSGKRERLFPRPAEVRP